MHGSRWLARPRTDPAARLRLFCFPYAGGGALVFRRWAGRLPAGVELCPVQLPGRGARLHEPLFTRLGPLLEALAPALAPYLDRPFCLFGHSMGALVAFELAHKLRRERGLEPAHLFVSGRRAPRVPDHDVFMSDLPDEALIDELRRLGGTPPEVLEDPELMRLMLPALRADFALCETYYHRPAPPLRCPLTAFGGLDDPEVTREHLAPWREETTGPFRLLMFPGDHFFLNHSLTPLLEAVSAELERQLRIKN